MRAITSCERHSRRPYRTGALAGFEPADIMQVRWRRGRGHDKGCASRLTLEAFLSCGDQCLAKRMATDDEVKHLASNLQHYRRDHLDEFERVGIKVEGCTLYLYDRAVLGLSGAAGPSTVVGEPRTAVV